MKKVLLFSGFLLLMTMSSAYAIPNLQLFIEGATYDTEDESWVTTSSTFNLYVIGANEAMSDVRISMALAYAKDEDPNGIASVDVGGTTYDTWVYGPAPIVTVGTSDPGDDLPGHGIFPAWYTEFSAGDFGLVGGVGNVMPEPTYWDPSTEGYLAGSKTLGQYKVFSISVEGVAFVHFDAYTVNPDGSIQYFAPFSHDASFIPEPGTMMLFGLGALGLGIYRRFKK